MDAPKLLGLDRFDRIAYQGASSEVTRGGSRIARLVPAGPPRSVQVSELNDIFARIPALDDDADCCERDIANAQSAIVPDKDPWEGCSATRRSAPMGMLVHTWVLIPGERGSEVRMSSPWRRHGDAAISVAAASQLLIGVHRATIAARRPVVKRRPVRRCTKARFNRQRMGET